MNKKPFVSIFELLNENLEKIKKEEIYTCQRLKPYEHKACVVYEGCIYALSDYGRDIREVSFIETKDSKEVRYASRTKFFCKETEVQYFPTIKEAEEFILAANKKKEIHKVISDNQLFKTALDTVMYLTTMSSYEEYVKHEAMLKAIEYNYLIEYNILKEYLKSYKESEYTEELIKELFQKAWDIHHNGYYWIKDLLTQEREKEIVFIDFVSEKITFIGIMQAYDFSYENIKILSPKLIFDETNR